VYKRQRVRDSSSCEFRAVSLFQSYCKLSNVFNHSMLLSHSNYNFLLLVGSIWSRGAGDEIQTFSKNKFLASNPSTMCILLLSSIVSAGTLELQSVNTDPITLNIGDSIVWNMNGNNTLIYQTTALDSCDKLQDGFTNDQSAYSWYHTFTTPGAVYYAVKEGEKDCVPAGEITVNPEMLNQLAMMKWQAKEQQSVDDRKNYASQIHSASLLFLSMMLL
jgi:hypothetical protein